jgi:hypothetical protein
MTNSTSKHQRAPRNLAFFLISLLITVIWSSAGHAREIRELRLHPLEITLAPGASMNLQVFALFDDETEEELTEGVVFEVKDHKVARIDGFVLTATGGGDTRIEASHDASNTREADPVELNVLKVEKLEISPTALALAAGSKGQLRALATLEDGQTGVDITDGVDWESRKEGVAVVSNTPGSKGEVTALSAGIAEISAEDPESGEKTEKNQMLVTVTGRGNDGDGDSGEDPPEIEELTFEVDNTSLIPGEAMQIAVTAEFEDGSTADVTDDCLFRSRRGKVASVSSTGRVTAGESGTAKIEIEHISGEEPRRDLEIWVGEVEQLTLQPKKPRLEVDETLALKALATYDNGRSADVTQMVSWTSGKTRVVTVGENGSAAGRLTAISRGETTVMARDRASGTKTEKRDGEVIVTNPGESPEDVPPDPDAERSIRDIKNLVFQPGSISLRPGESQSVRISAIYKDGWAEDVTDLVELRVRSRRVANVESGALITAISGGETEVRARYADAGRSSRVALKVRVAQLSSLRISPARIGLEPGATTQLRALAKFDNETAEVDVTETVEWSSDRTKIATVDDAALRGHLTAIEPGETEIEIRDPESGIRNDRSTGRVEVGYDLDPDGPEASSDTVVGLKFEPDALTLSVDELASFTVQGVAEDGTLSPLPLDELRLRVASRRIASINNEGFIEGRRGGTTALNVEYREENLEAALPITVREIIRLEIFPADVSLRVGGTFQLTAVAEYNDGTTGVDVTDEVEWRSRDRSSVSLDDSDQKGLLTGLEPGSGRVEVRHRFSKTMSDASTGSFEVVSGLQKIYVAPENLLAELDEEYQMSALAIFEDGATVDVTKEVIWSVSSPSIANISDTGRLVVTALSNNPIYVKAIDLQTGVSSTLSNGDATVSTSDLNGGGGDDDGGDDDGGDDGGDDDGGGTSPTPIGLQVSATPDTIVQVPQRELLAPGESRQLYALLAISGENRPFDRTSSSLWFSSNSDAVPVELGRITCREIGIAVISAALPDGSMTSTGTLGDVTIECTAAELVELRIVPSDHDLNYGKSKQLRAYRVYSSGVEVEITNKVIWESEDPSSVSVIESGAQGGRVTAHDDAIVEIGAYDPEFDISSEDTDSNSKIGVRKTRIRLQIYPFLPAVSPDGKIRGRVGDTMSLKAKVWYEAGPTQGVNLLVNWTSSDDAVVQMGTGRTSSAEFKVNQGRFLSDGEVVITATWPADEFSNELSDTIEVEVSE